MRDLLGHITTHPDRQAAYDEVHARPFPMLESPLRVSFIGLLADPRQVAEQRNHLQALAEQFAQPGPEKHADCYYQSFPDFDLRWERHQEFCTLTVLQSISGAGGFEETALGRVPAQWLSSIAGELVVAFHGLVQNGDSPLPGNPQLMSHFEGDTLFGSRIVDGRAAVWSSFRLYEDGFARFLLFNKGLSRFQAGRTLQRLMEVETYRVMALLGLPLARRIAPDVADMDQELAKIIDRISDFDGVEDEQSLLAEMSELAARVEQLRANSKYRFSATQAYYQLVSKRLADLREEKFAGVSTLGKFLERRLDPAVRTCAAVEEQLKDLSRRLSRASDLLRTRVDLSIEAQNQELLQSMNRRSALQLRLQQTVEGLSVVVISYYTVGLIKTLLSSAGSLGIEIDVDLLVGAAVIPVVLAVWLLVRKVRRSVSD